MPKNHVLATFGGTNAGSRSSYQGMEQAPTATVPVPEGGFELESVEWVPLSSSRHTKKRHAVKPQRQKEEKLEPQRQEEQNAPPPPSDLGEVEPQRQRQEEKLEPQRQEEEQSAPPPPPSDLAENAVPTVEPQQQDAPLDFSLFSYGPLDRNRPATGLPSQPVPHYGYKAYKIFDSCIQTGSCTSTGDGEKGSGSCTSTGDGEKGSGRSVKTPADFLGEIRGRPVVVKFTSSLEYRGILKCSDDFMNIVMEKTEEYVDGQLRNKHEVAFIKGTDILYISAGSAPGPC